MRLNRIFVFFLIIFVILGQYSFSFCWSWRDVKPGVTTIEELFELGGIPETVTLLTNDFLQLEQNKRKDFRNCIYSVRYYVSNLNTDETGTRGIRKQYYKGKAWYDSSKVSALTKAPLQLSDELEHIKFEVNFSNGKVSYFSYDFTFSYSVDKKKYIELFNSILGKPIQIKEGMEIDSNIIGYKDYSLSIFPRSRLIRLMSEVP